MNRGQGRWVLLTLLGVIALASGEWVGEGGLGLEGMNIVVALSPVLVVPVSYTHLTLPTNREV